MIKTSDTHQETGMKIFLNIQTWLPKERHRDRRESGRYSNNCQDCSHINFSLICMNRYWTLTLLITDLKASCSNECWKLCGSKWWQWKPDFLHWLKSFSCCFFFVFCFLQAKWQKFTPWWSDAEVYLGCAECTLLGVVTCDTQHTSDQRRNEELYNI